MSPADLWSYVQPILVTIGTVFVLNSCVSFYRSLFRSGNGVTALTEFQSPAEHEAINIQQIESLYRDKLATNDRPRKNLRSGDYSIGIITALSNERKAAISMLDEEHAPPSDFCRSHEDYNPYVWGSMSTENEAAHNVVIATFPAKSPGTVTAADVARLMVTAFPSIRLGLMVGIGGGVPSPNDIRLGDVVVSLGSGTTAGVVQYDFGKEEEGGFHRQGQLNSPPAALLSAITALEDRNPQLKLSTTVTIATSKIQSTHLNLDNEPKYTYQGPENDRLFESRYHGPGAAQWPIVSSLFRSLQRPQPAHKDCASCDPRMMVKRDPRTLPEIPRVHYGLIASGNKVIKSARVRDEIVASLRQDTNGGDCLCFEMEAAGLMNHFPCLVIRGISDYADAHKNDVWHNYAALTAAAYARELLRVLSTAEVSSSKPARDIIGEIGHAVETMRVNLHDQQIHDWLEPSDQQKNFDQAQDEIERYQTEITWLFEHQDYIDWSSHKIHHIWLHGQSGCGKTVLASTVVKRLSAEGKLCLYFFFDFRDTTKQSLESLLRSLIWQLFSHSNSESMKTLVRQLYENRKSTKSTIRKLKETFARMVEEVDEVQVVLDALDESTRKGTDRDELLRWLKARTQYEGTGVCKLRTIITSRSDQQDIVNVLGSRSSGRREIRIENESAKVKASIHQYIHTRLRNDGGFADWRKKPNEILALNSESQEEQEDIEQWDSIMKVMEERLVEKAGFMFRWASLTIDSLGEMGSIQKIKAALESLPNGLDEIYTRSLNEIKHHESDAIRILQFLLFSPMPLREEQVLEVTSVDVEAPPGCGIDPMRRMNSFNKLSSLMSTFIRKAESTGKLEIAHSSVRDYLLYTGSENPPKYRFREIPAKAAVVGVCLGYIDSILTHKAPHGLDTSSRALLLCLHIIWTNLLREQINRHPGRTKPIAQAVPLNHGSCAQKQSVQEEASRFILKFLTHTGPNLQLPSSLYLHGLYGGPVLYIASAIGVSGLSRSLPHVVVRGYIGFAEAIAPQNPFFKNALDRFGVEKHRKIESLLPFHLHYQDSQGIGRNQRYDSLVESVRDGRADADIEDVLYTACILGDSKIVELLLHKGANVNAQESEMDREYGTFLGAACSRGNEGCVRLLLANGADANAGGGRYGSPLQLTCSLRGEQDAIVKMLLEHGANVNGKGGVYGTALHVAVKRSHDRSIKVLLDAGADIHIEAGTRETILEVACFSTNEATFQLLLEAGADPNSPSPGRGKILQLAAFRKQPYIVRYILDTGVDLADLDGFTYWEREYIFRVARESCNEVVLERLEIRGGLEGRIHQGQSLGKPFPFL